MAYTYAIVDQYRRCCCTAATKVGKMTYLQAGTNRFSYGMAA